MTETIDLANESFRRSFRPREFGNVCVLTFGEDFNLNDPHALLWFNSGVASTMRSGMRGFVFDLNQFSRHDLKGGFEWVVSCLPCVPRNGGVFTWLHAARFVEEWKRLKLLGVPPENFENEREAIEELQTVLKAARVRVDLARRVGNSGVSLRQIANVAGLIESDVRRIAEGLQEPSDRVALLIWSTLDSLSAEGVATTPNPTDVVSEDQP